MTSEDKDEFDLKVEEWLAGHAIAGDLFVKKLYAQFYADHGEEEKDDETAE